MEKIEIRVERALGVPVDRHWHAVFGVAGGTIGRGGQNKLVLPDADAGVARVHAMVRLESEGAFIANLCERRSMQVNDSELRSGQELRLPLGATIVIGPYTLVAVAPGTPVPDFPAAAEPDLVQRPPSPVVAPAVSPAVSPSVSPPALAAADPGTDPANPFAFLGPALDSRTPRPVPVSQTAPVDALPPVAHPMSAAGLAGSPRPEGPTPPRPLIIPADFDTFAPRPATAASAGRAPWGEAARDGLSGSLVEIAGVREDGLLQALPRLQELAQRLDNPAHSGLPASLERSAELDPLRLFELQTEAPEAAVGTTPGIGGDRLGQVFTLPRRADAAGAEPPKEVARPLPTQAPTGPTRSQSVEPAPHADTASPGERPLYKLTGTVELVPQEPQARPAGAWPTVPPSVPAALDLELPLAAAPASAPLPASAPPPAAPTLDEQALIAAFLEGAGLAPDRVEMRLTPEFMRHFGEAFKVAVQGTIDLIAARSEIKREFRADVTVIASAANNPLKFLPTAEGVIMQLTGRSFPGFMAPVPAMKEAYHDLQVHQLALMAGIRAAYAEALTRFDPVELEKQFPASGSLIGRWSAARRKAGLWDGYRQSYLDIRRHAEDDLTAFSGRTFVQAYEAAAEAAGLAP
ncbi:MAG: type VI secretion system-associated FHA domain protein TagH [Curvibacter sp.]|nr:type VI secretion system-associated FHA domain protein TagH [Curvibacter sp.]